MVLTTGVVNNMRSMLTGWYRGKVSPPPQRATESEPADNLEEDCSPYESPQAVAETHASAEAPAPDKLMPQSEGTAQPVANGSALRQQAKEEKKNG
jgi:hypothetical protein